MTIKEILPEDKKFSVHTFMLTKAVQDNSFYNFHDINLQGIHISITNTNKYRYFRVEVNPHLLITDNPTKDDYIKIFTYSEENIRILKYKINEILNRINLDINDMTLSRIDLCVNKYFEDEKITKTYLKLLKKLSYNKTYRLNEFTCQYSDYKEMNKNSVRIQNGQRNITVYNKIFQQKQQNYLKDDPETILRFEVALFRHDIYNTYQKPLGINNPIELFSYITRRSSEIIGKYILNLNLNLKYVKASALYSIIYSADFYKNTKDMMFTLVETLKHSKNINTALDNMDILTCEQQKKRLLHKFNELSISPVTINNKSAFNELPSLYEVLFYSEKCYSSNKKQI